MKILDLKKQINGHIKIFLFGKQILSFKYPNKYRRLYNKRFKGLSREEIRYLLEVQFESLTGYKLNLDSPKTFNEKIQWIKYYYHDPLMTKCADKVAVREYVKETIGEEYLVPCLGIYDSPEEIDFNKLPKKFVLKVNWGCKQNIIVKDKAKLNILLTKRKLAQWLKIQNNHYYENFEWGYKNIKPKIICEQYLEGENQDLKDYKLFCFNGEYKFIAMYVGRGTGKTFANFYDRNLSLLPISKSGSGYYSNKDIKIQINNYDKMIEIAEKLSKPFPHVRVDLYEDINKNIYVGELTFSPANGTGAFEPKEWDKKFGDYFVLPNKKI